MRWCAALTCCAIALAAPNASGQQQFSNPLGYQPDARPHVLVDQTHDYLFVLYHLAYFLHEQGMLGAHSDRTITWDLIRNCDVVVTHQGGNDVPYTAAETEALRRFVARGGGLLLIGNNVVHARQVVRRKDKDLPVTCDDLPLNRLAAGFGLRFSDQPARQPLAIQPSGFAPELTGEVLAFQDPVSFNLGSFCVVEAPESEGTQVLLRDSSGPRGRELGVSAAGAGAAVLVAVPFGRGRVAALGGVDFIPTMDAPTKELFFERLFLWLGENSPQRTRLAGKGFAEVFPGIELHTGYDYELASSKAWLVERYRGRAPFIWPEHREVLAGVTVLYNEATQAEARRIMQRVFPRVRRALTEIYGRGPRAEKADRAIHFFCNTSGGYSWNRPYVTEPIVGLPGLSETEKIPAYKYHVIQHELTHAWGLPLGLSGHLLMSLDSIDLAEKMPEFRDWMEADWPAELARLRAADPDLKQIDLARVPDYREGPLDRLRWIKWNWTFRRLRRKYGPGYFARVIALAEKDAVGTREDIPALIYYLSLAAGENLFPWFAEHGTVVQARPLPKTLPVARLGEDR